MDKVKILENIVKQEMLKNNITLLQWSKSSCGISYLHTRKIKIPKPINWDTLGICFHEIGHIVLNHNSNKKRYVEEYEAEQYAIQKLKEYGFYKKEYEYQAISYVLMKIAQAKNRGHNMRDIPKEIIKWTDLKINKWNKAKKVFVNHKYYKRKKGIQIIFKN